MLNQNTQLVVQAIAGILSVLYDSFLYSSLFLLMFKTLGQLGVGTKLRTVKTAMNLVWLWSKWPALAYIILNPFFHLLLGEKMNFWFWLFEGLSLFNWWYYKDMGDDDDWKKLKKKVKEKVAAIGGKLVVVPEPT